MKICSIKMRCLFSVKRCWTVDRTLSCRPVAVAVREFFSGPMRRRATPGAPGDALAAATSRQRQRQAEERWIREQERMLTDLTQRNNNAAVRQSFAATCTQNSEGQRRTGVRHVPGDPRSVMRRVADHRTVLVAERPRPAETPPPSIDALVDPSLRTRCTLSDWSADADRDHPPADVAWEDLSGSSVDRRSFDRRHGPPLASLRTHPTRRS